MLKIHTALLLVAVVAVVATSGKKIRLGQWLKERNTNKPDFQMMMQHGRRHGRKHHQKMPSAVDMKVDACLKSYSKKPVNIFVNFDPAMLDKIPEMMNQFPMKGKKMEMMKNMAIRAFNSPMGPQLKKFMGAMMACHTARFTDALLKDLPDNKVNIAFGSGSTYYYITGTDARISNWTKLMEEAKSQVDFKAIGKLMKQFKHGGGDDSEEEMDDMEMDMDDMEMGEDEEENYMSTTASMLRMNFMNKRRGGKKFGGRHHNLTTNVSDNLKWGLINMVLGKTDIFSPRRSTAFDNPSYQIVTACEDFQFDQIRNKIDWIVDIMGNFANSTARAGYQTENVFIASPPSSVKFMIPTARYQICQRNGGVSAEQPAMPADDSLVNALIMN